MAGLAGAVLGAITFELIGATFFGLAETSHPISATRLTRLWLDCWSRRNGTAVAMMLPKPEPRATVKRLAPSLKPETGKL